MDREHDDNLDERYADRDYRFKDDIKQPDIKPSWSQAERDREKLSESWADAERSKEKQRGGFADAERKAEKKAKPISDKSTAGSSREAENAVASRSSFANNVQGKEGGGKGGKGGLFSRGSSPLKKLKKFGPIGLIVGLIGGICIIPVLIATSLIAFFVLEFFTEDFNSLEAGTAISAVVITRGMITASTATNALEKSAVQKKLIPFTGNKFKKMSSSKVARLKAQGVTFVNKGAVPDLSIKDINAHSAAYSSATNADGTLKQKVIVYDDGSTKRIVPADDFSKLINEDPNFRSAYKKGSRSWSGRISGWFDTQIVRFLKKFKLDRNLFKGWIAEVESVNAGNAKLNKTVASASLEANGASARTTDRNFHYDKDTQQLVRSDDTPGRSSEGSKKARVAALNNFKTTFTGVAKSAGQGSLACGIMLGLAAITTLVAAANLLKIVTAASTYAEATDKGKAGYGNESPITEYSNRLTEQVPTQTTKADGVTVSGIGDGTSGIDSFDNLEIATKYEYGEDKSAMESSGIMWSTTGSPANVSGESEMRFNQESGLSQLAGTIFEGGVKFTSGTYKACLITIVVAAAASVMVTAASVIGAIFTGGGTLIARIFVGLIQDAVIVAGIVGFFMLFGGVIFSKLADAFTQSFEDLAGEDFGNALTAGIHAYDAGNHRASGGSGGSEDAVLAFRHEQQKVIAANAELDRETHSPFDITNKNTFFGSILSKVAAFSGNVPTLTGALSTLGNITSSSVSTLLPTASALDDVEFRDNIGTCPNLESVGAVGDMYCQPYMVSDVTTKGISAEDVFQKVYMSDWVVDNKHLGDGTPVASPSPTQTPVPDTDTLRGPGSVSPWNNGSLTHNALPYFGIPVPVRKHNFILETDRCDSLYGSAAGWRYWEWSYSRSRGYYKSGKTKWGLCLDRAARDGVDNIIPEGYTGDVLEPEKTLIAYSETVFSEAVGDAEYTFTPPYPEGNEQINPQSNLGFYIQFCTQRYVPGGYASYGTVDDNISYVYSHPINALLFTIPVIGDGLSILDAKTKAEAYRTGWMNGLNCVANNDPNGPKDEDGNYIYDATNLFTGLSGGPGDDSATTMYDINYADRWNQELVYYQQYMEHARIMEAATDVLSSQSAFLEKLDAAYPQDESYEGILASLSGMTKEQTTEYLAVLKKYINGEFDPTYVASLYPSPYGWGGDEEEHSIEELNTQKTVLAKALKKFDKTKIFSMMSFSENRRKWVVDLV
ncbi:MAG: hypothetical protein LBQ02_02105 [Candidatus Nomurabacteria bacterium]|jgi:hypothetical protein|nr:hypothetical protein [Candidatus Nomurabacteria bacterium]